MPENQQAQTNEQPTLAEVFAAVKNLTATVTSMQGVQQQLVDHVNSEIDGGQTGDGELDADTLEALVNMTDEQLEAFNDENGTSFTRDLIQAEVDAYNAAIDAEAAGGDGEGSEAGAGASGAGTSELAAIKREVMELRAIQKRRENIELQAQDEIAFSELQASVATIATQRDQLIELSERLIAENDALRMAGQNRGGRMAGVSNIELSEVGAGGTIVEFEKVVNAKYLQLLSEKVPDKSAKSQAMDFGVKRHSTAYALWRKSGRASEFQFSVPQ